MLRVGENQDKEEDLKEGETERFERRENNKKNKSKGQTRRRQKRKGIQQKVLVFEAIKMLFIKINLQIFITLSGIS